MHTHRRHTQGTLHACGREESGAYAQKVHTGHTAHMCARGDLTPRKNTSAHCMAGYKIWAAGASSDSCTQRWWQGVIDSSSVSQAAGRGSNDMHNSLSE